MQIVDDVITVNENFSVSMKIKTVAENGLLFYASSMEDDMYAFSIALVEGRIQVVNTAGPDRNTGEIRRNVLTTEMLCNDGKWYTINVEKKSLVYVFL